MQVFEKITHGIIFIALLAGMILAISMTVFASTSLTQSEALAAEEIPDEDNPYRAIIMNASREEQIMLEQILYLESGIDTFESKIATMQVILNRVLDPRFPSSITGVLSQPKQYSTWKKRHKATPGETESDVIEWLCDGGPWVIGLDYIYQDNKPQGKEVVKIGKQYYGK